MLKKIVPLLLICWLILLFVEGDGSLWSSNDTTGEEQVSIESLHKSASKSTVSAKNKIVKHKPQEQQNMQNNTERYQLIAESVGMDVEEYANMKSDYFCDLALVARENCERRPLEYDAMEICLKMASYYTNSRHCGYRP
ncbi:MAG: hypothetical protein L3J75_12590 [Methylococcaceae bacterium]|nr:hypothetical protein [Methylococcaceae bacterium]